jgi:endonuclease/exonuclease/phosphatase family metal-dependent hydrolase
MTRVRFRAAILLAFWAGAATAQVDTLRIATYNLLKFPFNNGSGRVPYFRTVIRALQPDILVVQELQSAQGLLTFLNEAMNPNQSNVYGSAPYVNGPDTDNGLFFKPDKVELLGTRQIRTDLRNISEYALGVRGFKFHLYSAHLKAGSLSSDENRRLNEASTLRNYLNALPANFNFIVAGDFNMYGASEPAFSRLTGSETDNDGRLWDPINAIGEWNNNALFAGIHTQSTRTVLVDSGATGGLDDRFDMMLVSASLLASGGMDILPNAYKAFGNDGRHFNLAINLGANLAVPDSVANALYYASDHLPVYADFVVEATSAVENPTPSALPLGFGLEQNHPNPFSATGRTEIRFSLPTPASARLEIFNFLGQRAALLLDGNLLAGEHRLSWNGRDDDGRSVASGIYFYRLEVGSASKMTAVKKMVVLP